MILIDLFSGVGGFHAGLERAGHSFTETYFSEIDKHAIAVYKHHYEKAHYIESVQSVSGTAIREKHPKEPIIVTFGFPCQDISLAGKRAGLDGSRSGLFFEAIRIIKECRADIFIFENVKGLFSSNAGKDFETVLKTIADIGLYECEWQLVNTAWLLPQNRERVYFVGHLGTISRPQVFPFREADFVHYQQHGQDHPERGIANAIDANYHKGWLDHGQRTMIACALTEERTYDEKQIGRESRKDGRDFSPRRGKNVAGRKDDKMNTITANKSIDQLIAYGTYQDQKTSPLDGNSQTLNSGHYNQPKIIVPSATKQGFEVAEPGDSVNLQNPNSKTRKGRVGKQKAQTLDGGCTQAVIIAPNNREHKAGDGVATRKRYETNKVPSIQAHAGHTQQSYVKEGYSIRRLTPTETERLQGFEDNWTEYGNYSGTVKKVSDTQRYKQMGNAVTVDIVKIIAERLLK